MVTSTSSTRRKRSKHKKPVKGAAANFITRTRAIRKLQVSLADFRRLCILKGIYPREPRNKKKANRGSTAPATFYYTKDIQFLLHEPLLQKFREYKIFARKLGGILGRGLRKEAVKFEQQHKPAYNLSHLVKERYPTFADALRDLDDALCLVFLFSTLPSTRKDKGDVAGRCKQLCSEFEHYVIRTGALRKTFLSIKGIYYQAEVKGQTITWVVPYNFSQNIPNDVDFRVMHTFLEFYETLVGFVNYRLFADLNLVYPPRVDAAKLEGAAGLDALMLETVQEANRRKLPCEEMEDSIVAEKDQKKATEKRLASLESKLKTLEDKDDEENAMDQGDQAVSRSPDESAKDADMAVQEGCGDLPTVLNRSGRPEQQLFANCVFFLSREVPRHSLEFVIRSFGGRVGWDPSVGAGSPFNENDKAITHHVCDRPRVASIYLGRTYLQPQWVYDSANAGKLLIPEPYAVGAKLPPHLSPFVVAKEGEYVPPEAMDEAPDGAADAEDENIGDDKGAGAERDEHEIEGGDDDAEEAERAELEAEAAGVSFSEYQQRRRQQKKSADTPEPDGEKMKGTSAPVGTAKKSGRSKEEKRRLQQEKEEKERRELAMSVMSKKHKRLYGQIQYGKKKVAAKAENLKRKRQLNRGDKSH